MVAVEKVINMKKVNVKELKENISSGFRTSLMYIGLVIALFFLISNVSAVGYVNITSNSLNGTWINDSTSITYKVGMKFTANKNTTILNATFYSPMNKATKWYIYTDANCNTNLGASGSISGNISVINYNISQNTDYCLLVDNNGGNYLFGWHYDGGGLFPTQKTDLNYTARVYGAGPSIDTSGYLNLFNIITGQYNTSTLITNITIKANDTYSSNLINNFSIELNGINYTTTNGLITTNILGNTTQLYNLTFFNITNNKGYYFNKTYFNVNISNNFIGNLSQTDIKILGYEKITNNLLSGNISETNNRGTTNTSIFFTAGSYNLTWFNTTYSNYNITQEFTFIALQNNTINISGIYNQRLNFTAQHIIDNTTINTFFIIINVSNYSEQVNTTTGNLTINTIKNTNITAFIDANNYAISNITNYDYINSNSILYSKTFYLYKTNSILFNFFDNSNYLKINNMSIDLIGNYISYNFTTNNGSVYATLLQPDNYIVRYTGINNNYLTRFYYFTLTNRTNQQINLYSILSNNSYNFTIYVIDENTQPVPNAIVKSLKYNLSSNSYLVQEASITDVNGVVYQLVDYNSDFYKFSVERNNVTYYVTSPFYVNSPDITIQIILGNPLSSQWTTYQSLSHSLTFNNATNNFMFGYNNFDGITSSVCLAIYRVDQSYSLFNSSCASSVSTGSILLNVPSGNGSTYEAVSTYYVNGSYVVLDKLDYSFPETDYFGTTGLLLQILITTFVMFTAIWSTTLAVILTPISLLIGRIVSLNVIPYEVIIPLIIVGFIISFIIGDKS